MAREKLSAFPTAPDVTTFDYFVGVRDNDDGTFTNYKYTPSEIAGGLRQRITVSVGGASLTNDFFADNDISEFTTDTLNYIEGVNFTQSGDTITWIDSGVTFYVGQVLIAKI